MFEIIIIVYSAKYQNLYGNDPLASPPVPAAIANVTNNKWKQRQRRTIAVVETTLPAPAYERDLWRRPNYTRVMQNRLQEKQNNLFTNTHPNPVQLKHNNIFANQSLDAQYRNVRNNFLKHRGYDGYGYY